MSILHIETVLVQCTYRINKCFMKRKLFKLLLVGLLRNRYCQRHPYFQLQFSGAYLRLRSFLRLFEVLINCYHITSNLPNRLFLRTIGVTVILCFCWLIYVYMYLIVIRIICIVCTPVCLFQSCRRPPRHPPPPPSPPRHRWPRPGTTRYTLVSYIHLRFRRKLSKLGFDLHFCIMTSVWDFSNPPFYWMIS